MASARCAVIFADRLSEDLGALVQKASYDRCIDFGRVALEDGSTVHHRDAGDTHVVLDCYTLAPQLTMTRAFDARFDSPSPVRIIFGLRTKSRRPRIFYFRQRRDHILDEVIGIELPLHQPMKG